LCLIFWLFTLKLINKSKKLKNNWCFILLFVVDNVLAKLRFNAV
jgi:hypothetical protein